MMVEKRGKMLDNLRRIANKLNEFAEFRLKIRLLTIIACASGEEGDINVALTTAEENGARRSYAFEALCIIVKLSAQLGKIDLSRRVADRMSKMVGAEKKTAGSARFWLAEARISIARYSPDSSDAALAKAAVDEIHDHTLRNDARVDLDVVVKSPCKRKSPPAIDLHEIASVFLKLQSFEDGRSERRAPEGSSAVLRLDAQAVMSHILASLMR